MKTINFQQPRIMTVDAFGASEGEVVLRIDHTNGESERHVLDLRSAKELGLALITEAAKNEDYVEPF